MMRDDCAENLRRHKVVVSWSVGVSSGVLIGGPYANPSHAPETASNLVSVFVLRCILPHLQLRQPPRLGLDCADMPEGCLTNNTIPPKSRDRYGIRDDIPCRNRPATRKRTTSLEQWLTTPASTSALLVAQMDVLSPNSLVGDGETGMQDLRGDPGGATESGRSAT